MNQLLHNEDGAISLVEVIVTAVVFLTAAIGIMTTISISTPQSIGSSQKLEAMQVGKSVIDDLKQQVSADDWNTGNLRTNTVHNATGIPAGYTVTYETIDDPSGDFRKVIMNITY